MNAVNRFATIENFSAGNYYAGAGFVGSTAGFSAWAVCEIATLTASQHIIGNKTGNLGWRIRAENGSIIAEVGETAPGTITLSAASVIQSGKFMLVELRVRSGANAAIALYVNGRMVDSDALGGGNSYAPNAGVFSVGYDVNGAQDPALQMQLAGFGVNTEDPGSAISTSGMVLWRAISATPGGAFNSSYQDGVEPEDLTAYRVIFDNDGAHPLSTLQGVPAAAWAPYIGITPILAKTGSDMQVTNNAYPWL